jgi:L-threonylcarbamoyladenylate synthase
MPRLLHPAASLLLATDSTAPPPVPASLTQWQADPAVHAAAVQLAQGGLLGLPTETVYGLAADAHQSDAVRRIFAAKGRPADHPLIVHVSPDWQDGVAHHTEGTLPAFAHKLMHAFWPGPLTLILPRKTGHAQAAAGGQASVGLRCPAHPAAQAVLMVARTLGVYGVAAPSANRFGRVSPTTAAHVMDEFASLSDDALVVLDGGACAVGIESTIVDATRGVPVLLRPGMISLDCLQAACGQRIYPPEHAPLDGRVAPKASGTLASHYAPHAQVRLMAPPVLQAAVDLLRSATHPPGPPRIAVYAPDAAPDVRGHSPWVWRIQPAQAADCAQELFAVLRDFDAHGVQLIWVQTPPSGVEWDGVRDRLSRAAA